MKTNCIGHWKMNDDAANKTVVDSSGNDNDGESQQNTDILHTDGKITGALTFNGSSDFISIADNTFNSLSVGTLAFWIYTDALGIQTIFTASNLAFANTYMFFYIDGGGKVYFAVLVGGTYKVYQKTVDPAISAETWHFVVLVQDGSAIKLYVDNVLKATEDGGITNTVPGAFFDDLTGTISNFIGKFDRSTGPAYYWDGVMDCGAIFDKALSEEEVAFLWNEGNGTESLGPYHNVYRGQDGNIDYENCLAFMDLEDSQVSVLNQDLPPDTIWHFIRRQVSECDLESEDSPACVIVVNSAGDMVGDVPNPPLDLAIEGLSGGCFKLRWRYTTIGEELAPTGFNIYMDSGEGFDFNSPIATVPYGLGGFGEFEWISDPLTPGQRYRFCVRSYWTGEISYISPTGDILSDWVNRHRAYDGSLILYANIEVATESWSPFLTLTHPGVYSDKVRFDVLKHHPEDTPIDVDVYRDGEWVHVYEGNDYNDHAWTEKTFEAGVVTQIRIRFQNNNPFTPFTAKVYEVELWGALITESQNTDFVAAVADSVGPDAITNLRTSWKEI